MWDEINNTNDINEINNTNIMNEINNTNNSHEINNFGYSDKMSKKSHADIIDTFSHEDTMNVTGDTAEIFETFMSLKPSQIKYFKDSLFPNVEGMQHRIKPIAGLTCPDCGCSCIIKFGMNRLGKQRYRCKQCSRIFVISSKSPLSCSKKSAEKWLRYMECMAKGMSIRKTASIVGIHTNTSFHWRHKILNSLKSDLSDNLSGVVEIDEAIIPESFKGNHSMDDDFYMGRAPRSRGIGPSERLSVNRVRVLCCLDRTEDIFSQVIGRVRPGIKELVDLLKDRIKTGSTICTNNNAAYKFIAKKLELKLYKLASSNQVIEGTYHNQKAKSFGILLKRFIVGFNGVATKYLNHYITWLKWNCLGETNDSGFEAVNMFLKVAFSNARLRVCDLRLVRSIPERACS